MNHEKFMHPYHDRDMIFEFHEEEEEEKVPKRFFESSSSTDKLSIDEEENGENNNRDESKAFWELQEELLQTTLYRTTSFEAKVRQAAKEALSELNSAGAGAGVRCSCRGTAPAAISCWRCRLKQMSTMLQNDGFNCVVCLSKWKSSSEIPAAGQHTYLEVVQSADSKKGEIKVIIELNFRAEFEMSRSSQEYKQLVAKLPEVFVGKVERLRNLVKILCGACKKCMKERKLYMAPWRKHKYMQAKWQGAPLQQAAPPSVAVEPPKAPLEKTRASMLSLVFVDTLYQNKSVEVI